jgi:Protein of unknown function (DUF1573)
MRMVIEFVESIKITRISLFIAFLSAGMVALSTAQAQEQERGEGPILTWDKTTHDFGDIEQGEKVEYTYRFTNSGSEPLIITNVTTQCGCTTPKGWPRDPVPPGGKGEIIAAFNSAGKFGKQHKVVTIVSNAVNTEGAQLILKVNVFEKKSPD